MDRLDSCDFGVEKSCWVRFLLVRARTTHQVGSHRATGNAAAFATASREESGVGLLGSRNSEKQNYIERHGGRVAACGRRPSTSNVSLGLYVDAQCIGERPPADAHLAIP